MTTYRHPGRAASFGRVAKAYEQARPGYPAGAVAWLAGDRPARVLDLGAGTGKLTRALRAAGHDVVAVDPSEPMLAELRGAVPGVEALVGTAESIPLPDGSVDVVTVAQAFHWFDPAAAVPEITRVLRAGGNLALVWNLRDEAVPWVGELWASIAPDEPRSVTTARLPPDAPFGPMQTQTFSHVQRLDRDAVLGLALSRSYVAVASPRRQAELLEAAGSIFDRHEHAGEVTLPYVTHCFRARLTAHR